jgi:hypothetical protein
MRMRWVAASAAALFCMALIAPARPIEHQPAAKPAAVPAAPAPKAPAGAVGALQPVLHAQQAKITTCMDTIARQSGAVINGPHQAISSWTQAAPNRNLFVSMVGLSYQSPVAPNGAAVMLAAPLDAGRCEGEVVEIVPSARACSVIQASLVKTGRTIAMLRGLAVVQTNSGVRDLLMPTVGGGCTLVAVGVEE